MSGRNYSGHPWFGQGYASYVHWGVDSLTQADAIVPGGEFFEVLAEQAGRRPEFWGRYIGRKDPTFDLTSGEIKYLARKNCRILVILGGEDSTTVSRTGDEGRLNGTNAARRGIDLAKKLGVPGGVPFGRKRVYTYCNIENTWTPTVDFFGGWFDTMEASEYGGGVYGDTHNPPPLPSNAFSAPYCAAYAAYPSMRNANAPALLWNLRPQRPCNTTQGFGNGPNARGFNPDRPFCDPPTVAVPSPVFRGRSPGEVLLGMVLSSSATSSLTSLEEATPNPRWINGLASALLCRAGVLLCGPLQGLSDSEMSLARGFCSDAHRRLFDLNHHR